jgi:hypothetical protein
LHPVKSWPRVQLRSLILNKFNFEGQNLQKQKKIATKRIRIKFDRKKNKEE